MTTIAPVAAPPTLVFGTSNVSEPAAGRSLLPEPNLAGLDATDMLYVLQGQEQALGVQTSTGVIKQDQAAKDKAVKDQIAQVQKAIEASQHHSFWDDVGNALGAIGQVCAVVGSVAIAVASCGAGTVVAALAISACVLSTAGMAESQFHVLEDVGVDPNTAGMIGMGLSIGGAALSVGAGFTATGAEVADDAVKTTTTVAKATAKAAQVISGVADVGRGVTAIVSSSYEAESIDDDANAKADQFRSDLLQKGIDLLITGLGDDQKSSQRRQSETQGVIQTYGAAMNAALMGTT